MFRKNKFNRWLSVTTKGRIIFIFPVVAASYHSWHEAAGSPCLPLVINFDQCLGAAHAKCWLIYAFYTFFAWIKRIKKRAKEAKTLLIAKYFDCWALEWIIFIGKFIQVCPNFKFAKLPSDVGSLNDFQNKFSFKIFLDTFDIKKTSLSRECWKTLGSQSCQRIHS